MRKGVAIGFVFLLGFDVMAQVGFKLAADSALPMDGDVGWLLRLLAHPGLYMAVAGYLGAFVTWMSLLRHAPIGPAFAASHLEVVAVMPFAVLLFGERLDWPQLLGAVAIVAGILCLALEEEEHATPPP